MNTQSKTIDQDGVEQLDPKKALMEQTLAVDLAGVEIDRAIATAHKYPRHLDTVVKKIGTLACYNNESAETCIYSLPRGGKPIIGPSIGFANIVLQSWGNCRAASQIVYIDTKQKVVIAQGAFMDLETNAQSIVPVNRRIVDSKGRLYNDDMQIVTGMAAASIARRNAILQGVPRGIWFSIWQDALNIVRGTVETFSENKDKAMKAMAQFGVKPEQVFLYLGLKGEIEMTFEHIPYVRGMYQQLRDSALTVEQMFDPRRLTGKGFETEDNPLGHDDDAPATATAAQSGGSGTAQPGPAQATPAATVARDETAGMGDAPTPKPQAAAQPAAQPAQGELPVQPATKTLPAQETAQAATPAKVATAAKPVEAAKPTNAADYLTYWAKWCAEATDPDAIQAQYSADRNLRKNCAPFEQAQYEEMGRIKDDRMAELRK